MRELRIINYELAKERFDSVRDPLASTELFSGIFPDCGGKAAIP